MARLINGKQILDDSIGIIKIKDDASQGTILFGAGTMIGLTDAPTVGTDVANKTYVDSVAAGLDPKESVRVATVAALTGGTYDATGGTASSGAFAGVDTAIDGIALVAGDRVLVKDQADAKQNGIYEVITAASGVWNRASDQDGSPSNEVSAGNFTFVETGATQATEGWVLQGDGELTLNTDDLDWVQFSESTSFLGGNGININGNTIDADADEVTISATGGTGNVQLEVIKVPNALSQGTGITTFSYDGSGVATVAIDNTGVAAAAYGSASSVATFTVNAQGQLTTATTVPILITKSQISDYDTERFVTGGTYSNGTGDITFTDNLANTFTVDLSSSDLNDTFTTGSTLIGTTAYFDTTDAASAYTLDLQSLSAALSADTFVTGGTYSNGTGDITLTLNDASTVVVDLSSLDLNDTFVTGATYSTTTDVLTLTRNDASTVTATIPDNFATGATLIGTTLYVDRNDTLSAFTADLSSLATDANTFTTGSTLIGDTAYFDTNAALSAFTLDLSSLDVNDTFVTGGTIPVAGTIRHTRNDDVDVDITGASFTLTTSDGVTADTATVNIGGSVNVGLSPSAGQKAVPTKADKNLTPAASSGNNFNTSLTIAATPTNDGYVTVSVNGVSYIVGDGTTGATADCYFSGNGGTVAKAIEDIAAGDELFWNGTAVGFDLTGTDHVDLHYDVLQ